MLLILFGDDLFKIKLPFICVKSILYCITSGHFRGTGIENVYSRLVKFNRPFPSCLLPQFKNESPCETIQMKMTLICMKMDMKVVHIFI